MVDADDEYFPFHHPNVPPCLPGKNRLTLRNDAASSTKAAMVSAAVLRPRQPTVRAWSSAAYRSQVISDHTCTGSHDQNCPHDSLASTEPVMMPTVKRPKPHVTKR